MTKTERIVLDIKYCSLKTAIAEMQEVYDKLPEYAKDKAEIDLDQYEEYGSSYCDITVTYQRPLTEEEQQKADADKAHWAAQRKKQYEQLKKEFGDA